MITIVEFLRPVPIRGDPHSRVKAFRKNPNRGEPWSVGDIDIEWKDHGVCVNFFAGGDWPREWDYVYVPWANVAFVVHNDL